MAASTGKRAAPPRGPSPLWRRFAIRLVAVCVLGILAGAGWVLLQTPTQRQLTSYGLPVSNADAVLSQAQASMRQLVHDRHGRAASDARCYFSSATPSADQGSGSSAATAADGSASPAALRSGASAQPGSTRSGHVAAIGDRVFCGPVVFVDGDPSRPYLTFRLATGTTADGRARLTLGAPEDAGTSALSPDPRPGLALLRPDGRQPPAHPQLTPPQPPAAVTDLLTTASTLPTPLTPASSAAQMVGQVSGVRLVEYGFVQSFGWGDRARTAPPGYRLLAFATEALPGELDSTSPDLSVRVNGTERGPLAATSDYVVTTVPRKAKAVDLVLTDSGLKQSISLLTGKPDPANPAVTMRTHDGQQLGVARPIKVKLTTAAGSATVDATVSVTQVSLTYWASDGSPCPGPDRAWLHVGATLKVDGDPQPYGAEPTLLSVRLPGSTPVPTRNAAADPASQVDDVVQVPASITTGSVTVAGTAHTDKGTLTVLTPVTVPFNIPAG